ncbi:MAG: 50S ribosomal protein L30e [Hadesarchaea archaeon]|nr:MAG: 50S ribosomal protein L30e [Hadesarchaea archaeon]
MELSKEIRQAVAAGNVVIGTDKSLKVLKQGKAKLVVVASNCSSEVLADVERYAKLGNVPVHVFDGNSEDLGLLCGKPFLVSVLTIVEGESRSSASW